MKTKLLFVLMLLSQSIFTSQAALSSANAVDSKNSLKIDNFQELPSNARLQTKVSAKNNSKLLDDDNQSVTSLDVLDDNSFIRPYVSDKKDINLQELFEKDIENFFVSLDYANQESLVKFLLALINKKIILNNDYLKNKIIKMIVVELDFTTARDSLIVLKDKKAQKTLQGLLEKKIEAEPFNQQNYSEEFLIKEFNHYFEDKDIKKIKEEILSLKISGISSNNDLSVIFDKIFFKNHQSLSTSEEAISVPGEVVKQLIDTSSLSIESLSKNQLKVFLTVFVRNNCFYGIEKIIDSNKFKEFSFLDVANILVFIINQYQNSNSYFNNKFASFLGWANFVEIHDIKTNNNNDKAYIEIILKLFSIKNNPKKIIELFVDNYKEARNENKGQALVALFVLAKHISKKFIPILIEASKYYKYKTFLYNHFDAGDIFYKEGQTFLSILVLNNFFNDSKEELIKLLDQSIIVCNKSLVRSILYQGLFNFSQDANFIKNIKEKIDKGIEEVSRRYEISKAVASDSPDFPSIMQKQQNFLNELKALSSLKDELVGLTHIDHMFYSAYLEYLKGNKQDLRNLVFPVAKNVYALAPEKGSETQVMSLIRNSLKKMFKEDRIKFLLFDLVETNYQKQSALELLDFMGLKNQLQSSPAAKASM